MAKPKPKGPAAPEGRVRRRIRVRGIVQGVGFRPTVYRLAHERGLGGWVLNDAEGVLVELEGPAGRIDDFLKELRDHPPPLARITAIEQRGSAGAAARRTSQSRPPRAAGGRPSSRPTWPSAPTACAR